MKKLEVLFTADGRARVRLHAFTKTILLATLALVLCFGVTACGKKKDAEMQPTAEIQLTMTQIVEANSTENILRNYTSAHHVTTGEETYIEANLRYSEVGEFNMIQTPDNTYRRSGGIYGGVITPGSIWEAERVAFSYLGIDPTMTLLEDIQKVEDNGDTIAVHSTMPANRIAIMMDIFGGNYEAGGYVESIYTLDKKTLVILEFLSTFYNADGTKNEEVRSTTAYNAPRPQGANNLIGRISDPANLRTVTIIANPGTEKESKGSAKMPKGEKSAINFYEGRMWAVYADAACTELFVGDADTNADITVYCRNEERLLR